MEHRLTFDCIALLGKFTLPSQLDEFNEEFQDLLASNEYELPLQDLSGYKSNTEFTKFGSWNAIVDTEEINIRCIVYFDDIVPTSCPDQSQSMATSGELEIQVNRTTGEIIIRTDAESEYD